MPDEEELASSDEEDVDDEDEPVGEAVVYSVSCEQREAAPATRVAQSEEQAPPAPAATAEPLAPAPEEDELVSSDEEDVNDDEEEPVREGFVQSVSGDEQEPAPQPELDAAAKAQELTAAAQEWPRDCSAYSANTRLLRGMKTSTRRTDRRGFR